MNTANFDLNLLRAFDALMRERNVSRAAQRMFLSQPAMSNTLNRLREALDDPVLVRTRDGMQPTPKALGLEQTIRATLQDIDKCLSSEQTFNPATSDHVFHIATTDYVELTYLPKLLTQLADLAPNVRLEIHSLGPDIPEAELEEGKYDFAIGRFTDVTPRLNATFWLSGTLVALVRNGHPMIQIDKAGNKTISLEDFLRVKQVWVNGGQRSGVVDQWLKQNNRTRKVKHTTPSFLIAPGIVAYTDMLVVTPLAIAQSFSRFLPLSILNMPMDLEPFNLHILSHPYHASTPAHRWLEAQLLALVP